MEPNKRGRPSGRRYHTWGRFRLDSVTLSLLARLEQRWQCTASEAVRRSIAGASIDVVIAPKIVHADATIIDTD